MNNTSNFEFGEVFKKRTKAFALDIIKLYQGLPKTGEAKVIGNQFLRSGTSVAANYRAACRGRSTREFYSKLCIVVEEADETEFWLEILEEAGILVSEKLKELRKEASEILSITSKARANVRK